MKPGKPWVRLRHRIIHHVLIYPVRFLFYILYGFRGQRFSDRGREYGQPYLILGNHTTPLDPICLGTSFGFPIYYVASDHVLRVGWVSRLLTYMVAPIPIVKSRLDLQTIKDMMTIAAQGGSICLFPEGNRNYNGETIQYPSSVAKLAKKLKIPLLLYRMEGGYLTAPRWADSIRRGRFSGRVVRVVATGEMDGMTGEELYSLIQSELYENAFERQAHEPARYRGRRLAESLERALYLCPRCLGMATMKSADDRFYCFCGLSVRFGETGFFEQDGGEASPFATVLDWDHWQKSALPSWLAARAGSPSPLMQDDGQVLYACDRAGSNKLIAEGSLSLFTDRFCFQSVGGKQEFPLETIDRLIIHGKQSLQFTALDITYEVRSPHPRSALKYLNVFNLLRDREGESKNGFFGL